jgi:glycosyltransferase involved in cell wall biosynthesis
MRTLVVVMPVMNEEEGISEFILELQQELSAWSPKFVIVDDQSTDNTVGEIHRLKECGIDLILHLNESNLGHGPSTIKALQFGMNLNSDFIVAVDGDGQFLGSDIRNLALLLDSVNVDVVEGVRLERNEPLYRKFVTLMTRVLVLVSTRHLPRDANTPLRGYRPDALKLLLSKTDKGMLTPNLLFSALSRKWKLDVLEVPVRSIPRRGSDSQGTMFGKGPKSLPSRRFIGFLWRALLEWTTLFFSLPVDNRQNENTSRVENQ